MSNDLRGAVKRWYEEGQNANRDDPNPYNRKTQIKKFHCWSAGYCDKYGTLPKES